MRHAHVLCVGGGGGRGRREEGKGGRRGKEEGQEEEEGGEDKVRIVIFHNVCIQPIPQGGV